MKQLFGGTAMKTMLLILTALSMMLTACSSTRYANSSYDDVYYTPGDRPVSSAQTVATTTTTTTTTSDGTTDVESYSTTEYDDKDYSGESYEEEEEYYSPNYSTSEEYTDENGTTYVTNNYYE
ncbi:MAG: hypothetical protein KJ607_00735, partial [Bacteroidetes bacterium]|nr:hypothetical protein [Bacteroidota bacterium]